MEDREGGGGRDGVQAEGDARSEEESRAAKEREVEARAEEALALAREEEKAREAEKLATLRARQQAEMDEFHFPIRPRQQAAGSSKAEEEAKAKPAGTATLADLKAAGIYRK